MKMHAPFTFALEIYSPLPPRNKRGERLFALRENRVEQVARDTFLRTTAKRRTIDVIRACLSPIFAGKVSLDVQSDAFRAARKFRRRFPIRLYIKGSWNSARIPIDI